jgi:hypothetical protein
LAFRKASDGNALRVVVAHEFPHVLAH